MKMNWKLKLNIKKQIVQHNRSKKTKENRQVGEDKYHKKKLKNNKKNHNNKILLFLIIYCEKNEEKNCFL